MNKIEKLENKLNELKEELEELKKKQGKSQIKRWRAETGTTYYFLNPSGISDFSCECEETSDDLRYKIGNYYEARRDAEAHAQRILVKQELEDIALELNAGEEINWENTNLAKYHMYYDYINNAIINDDAYDYKAEGTTYCLSSDFTEVAIERIGKERLEKYLKGDAQ